MTRDHNLLSYKDAAGQTTFYTYNSAGQLLTVTDALGEKTGYAYDSFGRLTTITNAYGKKAASYTYDKYGNVASFTDADGWTVQYEYDNGDRLTKATYPDKTTELYGYHNLDLVSYTDRQKNHWAYAYDPDRRLTSVADPLGHKTIYTYYEDGTVKSVKDPNGLTTSWDIDLEGRTTAEVYPDGTETTYTYENATNRLLSETDPNGQTKYYQYTVDDRLAAIIYAGALNPTPNVYFTYDQTFPRLASVTDGTGTTTYSYVPVGQLGALQLQEESGPLPNGTTGYKYDRLGRVVGRSVGGASPETFQYDKIDRLVGHTDALGSFALSYLGETHQPSQRLGPASVSTTWTYSGNSGDRRLASIVNASSVKGERQFDYRDDGRGSDQRHHREEVGVRAADLEPQIRQRLSPPQRAIVEGGQIRLRLRSDRQHHLVHDPDRHDNGQLQQEQDRRIDGARRQALQLRRQRQSAHRRCADLQLGRGKPARRHRLSVNEDKLCLCL